MSPAQLSSLRTRFEQWHQKTYNWPDGYYSLRDGKEYFIAGLEQQWRAVVWALWEANDWKEAVLDELAVACMDAPFDEPPRSILKRVIAWNVQVALDPSVSNEAQALIDKGRESARVPAPTDSEGLAGALERMGFTVRQNGDALGLGGNVCAIEGDEKLFFALLAGAPSQPQALKMESLGPEATKILVDNLPALYSRDGPASPSPLPAQPPAEGDRELMEILSELVACKDLKDEFRTARSDPHYLTFADRLESEYERRKPIAWERARAVLRSRLSGKGGE